MARLIGVGDNADGCDINAIMKAMIKSGVYYLKPKWIDLANELEVSSETKTRIENEVKLPAFSSAIVLSGLLRSWQKENSTGATIEKLITALENLELTDLADTLRLIFCETYQQSPEREQKQSKDRKRNDTEPLNNNEIGFKTNDLTENAFPDCIFPEWFFKSTQNKFTDSDVLIRTIRARSDLKVDLKQSGSHSIKKVKPDYKMPKGFSGYALILNIMRFPNSDYRNGAQYDSIRMKQLLIQLGYQLLIYDDVSVEYTLADIRSIIDTFKAQIKKDQNQPSIFVFVGSHGVLNKLTLSDGSNVNIYENIVYQFDQKNFPELIGVPKIFVLQCCRNSIKSDSGYTNIDNTLVCYATLPNNRAQRDENRGAIYIESLVRMFCEYAYCRHLKEILNLVELDLGAKPIQYTEKPDHIQQPMYENLGGFGVLYFNI